MSHVYACEGGYKYNTSQHAKTEYIVHSSNTLIEDGRSFQSIGFFSTLAR